MLPWFLSFFLLLRSIFFLDPSIVCFLSLPLYLFVVLGSFLTILSLTLSSSFSSVLCTVDVLSTLPVEFVSSICTFLGTVVILDRVRDAIGGVIGSTGSFDSGVFAVFWCLVPSRVRDEISGLIGALCPITSGVCAGVGISMIVRGNLDCDSFTVYWYCVAAAVFDQILFLRCAAIAMDLMLCSLQFSKDGWGVIVCVTGFSVYIFVIVCIHVINISRKG